ncbi:MAG TPA: SDR family oxidoreductase [Terracidiphilus sp.]|jgi:3-oxoacyl-[acyl-carrier protein] reductase|nr:SDR family oxidoreductase [Terracidiphilus sp.]
MAGISLTLEGKVALVTGGSRGVGAETVRLFAEAGAHVVFNYRQARQRAEALVRESRAGRRVAIHQELDSPAAGRALVEKTVHEFGRLDILVVNHGLWPPQDTPVSAMSDDQWRRTLAVNLDSVFGLVQAAAAQMQRQAASAQSRWEPGSPDQPAEPIGHMVLISSTAGQRGEAFHADYAAAKGAMISLTKSLSSELAPRGIRVNCVAPGWVATEMSAPALGLPEHGARIVAGIPLGRVASPREIAGPVLFLCTPLAGYISGEILNVNGGSVLAG